MTTIEIIPIIHQSARGTIPVQAANTSEPLDAQPGANQCGKTQRKERTKAISNSADQILEKYSLAGCHRPMLKLRIDEEISENADLECPVEGPAAV